LAFASASAFSLSASALAAASAASLSFSAWILAFALRRLPRSLQTWVCDYRILLCRGRSKWPSGPIKCLQRELRRSRLTFAFSLWVLKTKSCRPSQTSPSIIPQSPRAG
jgi:hypothetical protein